MIAGLLRQLNLGEIADRLVYDPPAFAAGELGERLREIAAEIDEALSESDYDCRELAELRELVGHVLCSPTKQKLFAGLLTLAQATSADPAIERRLLDWAADLD